MFQLAAFYCASCNLAVSFDNAEKQQFQAHSLGRAESKSFSQECREAFRGGYSA